MGAIDAAKKHFKEQETIIIEVPEWGDGENPLLIYSDVQTVKDRNWSVKHADGDDIKTIVYTLIRMAKDKKGNPIFTLEDKLALMENVDSSIIVRVVGKIARSKKIEDLKKK